MTSQILIKNQAHITRKPLKADFCTSFWSRLHGLMFRKTLGEHEGILMVQPHANRLDSAIHMFFMNFDIAVIWADNELRVVDVKYAKRWRPYYAPSKAAKFVLETHPKRLKDFQVGDQLVVINHG